MILLIITSWKEKRNGKEEKEKGSNEYNIGHAMMNVCSKNSQDKKRGRGQSEDSYRYY